MFMEICENGSGEPASWIISRDLEKIARASSDLLDYFVPRGGMRVAVQIIFLLGTKPFETRYQPKGSSF